MYGFLSLSYPSSTWVSSTGSPPKAQYCWINNHFYLNQHDTPAWGEGFFPYSCRRRSVVLCSNKKRPHVTPKGYPRLACISLISFAFSVTPLQACSWKPVQLFAQTAYCHLKKLTGKVVQFEQRWDPLMSCCTTLPNGAMKQQPELENWLDYLAQWYAFSRSFSLRLVRRSPNNLYNNESEKMGKTVEGGWGNHLVRGQLMSCCNSFQTEVVKQQPRPNKWL